MADFIGSPAMNFFKGSIRDSVFQSGSTSLNFSGYDFTSAHSGDVWLGVRPEHIRAGELARDCDFQATLQVDLVEPMGSDTLVWSKLDNEPMRIRVDGQTSLRPGESIDIGFDVSRVSLFDVSTEARL